MKPKLILHIGRPKTGSTALQRFLFENKVALKKHRILYPDVGTYQHASHLFSYAYEEGLRKAAKLKPVDIESMYDQLEEEVKQSQADIVVLSSENFWFIDPSLLPSRLSDFYDVHVVVYIRRQDSVITSSFCEEVKRGLIELDSDVEEYAFAPDRLELLDYFSILQPWAEKFGDEKINVRLYEDAIKEGMQQDFCQVLGVGAEKFKSENSVVNPSLPYDVLKLIEYVRRLKLGDQVKRRFVTVISETIGVLEYEADYDASGIFSPELRSRIMKKFEASNQKVVNKYLNSHDGPLFFRDVKAESAFPKRDITVERLAHLLLGLQAQNEKSNLRFNNRLRRLEDQAKDNKALLGALLSKSEG